ncbi:MAG: hypothetical protein RIG61_04975 [Deltaproteobacteria bacterium]
MKPHAMTPFFLLLLFASCNSAVNEDSPEEQLNSYCVRECVIETSDAEICDTRCRCAVEKLSSRVSERELKEIVKGITIQDDAGKEGLAKMRGAFQLCE